MYGHVNLLFIEIICSLHTISTNDEISTNNKEILYYALMNKPLPPLDHLRAFEAAGRHLSFKEAAEELNVTPAAVGQRIRSLESQLGTVLFHRKTRQVHLTDEGALLLDDVSVGLDRIRIGISRLAARKADNVLTVSATNSFAEMVLLPKLPEFLALMPDSDVRLVSTDERLDLNSYDADVAVRFGRGNYPQYESLPLYHDLYVPVCSSSFALMNDPIEQASDLLSVPLVEAIWPVQQVAAPSWKKWFESNGLSLPAGEPRFNLSVEAHAIRAALSGQGVTLANYLFVRDEIAKGSLIRLLPKSGDYTSVFQHYLLWRKNDDKDLVVKFKNWLAATFQS